MKPKIIANWKEIADRTPTYALVAGVDLVVIRYDSNVSVLYGRCLHRGALMSDGYISGDNIICGVHDWDYRYDTGISEYDNDEVLTKFTAWVEDDNLFVNEDEIKEFSIKSPQPFNRDEYLGLYADTSHAPQDEDKQTEEMFHFYS